MEIPPRVEYALTEHGRELWPILHRLAHWARGEAFDGFHDMRAPIHCGKSEILYDEKDIALIAVGSMRRWPCI